MKCTIKETTHSNEKERLSSKLCKLMTVPYFYTEVRIGLGSPKIFLTLTVQIRFMECIKGCNRVGNIKTADTHTDMNIP
jgi:hypothetical protein